MRLLKPVLSHAFAGAAGALIAYYRDPDRGRARRARAKDQMAARRHDALIEAEQKARYAKGRIEGARARAHGLGKMHPADDHVIKQGIEQAFARTRIDVHDVVIDVANGIAGLRGQVSSASDLVRLKREAAEVPGVERVQSWLHLPGEAAPNKAEAQRTTSR